eukprot:8100003-Heterocapsa_arctica.AAC.1
MVKAEAKSELEVKQRAWLDQRADELRGGAVPHEACQPRTPADAPSIGEQRIHYVTHLPRATWCIIFALAASRAGAHLSADG